jgi:stringent starvation protein B
VLLFMTSTQPYLLRALYDWILDNNLTPFLLVDASITGVDVPEQYIEDNKIILNLLPTAVHQLVINNEAVTFSTRFNNNPYKIHVPVRAVMAIYAKETGKGLVFTQGQEQTTDTNNGTDETPDNSPKVTLKVIK